ncbi:GntR family transcriptional regulator [Anopheles sinensis]|uniref:GntR family transcriptional regulator n=1 Tax=Anopheles sinensis TaxID=74873 RepID=A0A084VUR8_ANOSI|nr:GntR family transcriptional regulator [Anopheles sinensis]
MVDSTVGWPARLIWPTSEGVLQFCFINFHPDLRDSVQRLLTVRGWHNSVYDFQRLDADRKTVKEPVAECSVRRQESRSYRSGPVSRKPAPQTGSPTAPTWCGIGPSLETINLSTRRLVV